MIKILKSTLNRDYLTIKSGQNVQTIQYWIRTIVNLCFGGDICQFRNIKFQFTHIEQIYDFDQHSTEKRQIVRDYLMRLNLSRNKLSNRYDDDVHSLPLPLFEFSTATAVG